MQEAFSFRRKEHRKMQEKKKKHPEMQSRSCPDTSQHARNSPEGCSTGGDCSVRKAGARYQGR